MTATFANELSTMIRARRPVIAIETSEEARAEDVIAELLSKHTVRKEVIKWSVTRGIFSDNDGEYDSMLVDAGEALRAIMERQFGTTKNAVFIFRDLHLWINDGAEKNALVLRLIRDIAREFHSGDTTASRTLIILGPHIALPDELKKDVALLTMPLPSRDELQGLLDEAIENINQTSIKVALSADEQDSLVTAMQGLTLQEASYVLQQAIASTLELSAKAIPLVLHAKGQFIKQRGLLEFIERQPKVQMGGNDILMQYAARKRKAMKPAAREYGIPTPKGVLLVGVPGGGKSLFAQLFSGEQMPLLRCELGRLMGSLLGESERNLRELQTTVTGIGQCVLWIDEIEKAPGGMGGEHDGGTAMRMFGSLLTWMEEQESAYIIATANDVRGLRPELLRRFDDLFFVDLPNTNARAEIFALQLQAHKRNPNDYNIQVLADATEGFSGAEIKKVVVAGLEAAYDVDEELGDMHMLNAATEITPISKTMQEQIDNLRAWAKIRARPASSEQPAQTKKASKAFGNIELN